MEENNKKKTILIIDDDAALNAVLTEKLKISGYSVHSAYDGEEGLKMALEFHPDVILLDLIMPKIDGMETLSKLREDPWGEDVKVIVLTLLDHADYVAKTMQNNILGYIVKTDYSIDGVVKQIESMIK